jgi:hypothetical protein
MYPAPRVSSLQRNQRAAATDLDIVAVGADAQHVKASTLGSE